MSVDVSDFPRTQGVPSQRYSATQAAFQFACSTFIAVILAAVIVAVSIDGARPGLGRLLLLASGVSLAIPAAIAARVVVATTASSASSRSFDGWVKAVVAAISLSMVLFFAAALVRESPTQKSILDPQRDTARLLFGIDDLANAKLVTYSKVNDKIEAEFAAAGRKIGIVVTSSAAE